MNSEKLLEESFRYENSLCKFFVTEDTAIPTASRLRLSNAKNPRHLAYTESINVSATGQTLKCGESTVQAICK